jgi:uncharacterized delta-60 repeat protein
MKKIILFLFTLNCFSQAGSFDTAFDTDGLQTYCLTPVAGLLATNAELQSTGKIIQFGYSNSNSIYNFIRYNTDGSIDSSFGNNGILSLTNNSLFQNQSYISDFTMQADDKILITGYCSTGVYVARLLPDGNLDSSFNGMGYLSFDFSNFSEDIGKIIVQPDGKILVCGAYGTGFSTTQAFYAVARITTSGVLDTTFGIGGKVVLANFSNGPFSTNYARSMTVQPDGKILVGGATKSNTTQANDLVMVRFNANGTVDANFGTDGKVMTSAISAGPFGISKLLVQPDGNIVAGAVYSNSGYKMALLRYMPNGVLDPTFGINGIVATTEFSHNCSVAMQGDGKFILAGGLSSGRFKIFRYTATGVLDTTFANNANVFPVTEGEASTVLIQNDQKIIVCGDTYNSTTILLCAVVIRLNNDVLGTEGFAKSELTVSPNPVQSVLSVSNKVAMQYEMFTVLGAKIKVGSLAIYGHLDCSSLAKGLYLLKLNKVNGESKVVKVVKE